MWLYLLERASERANLLFLHKNEFQMGNLNISFKSKIREISVIFKTLGEMAVFFLWAGLH